MRLEQNIAGVLFVAALAAALQAAPALARCGPVAAIPSFSLTIDPKRVPEPPPEPLTLRRLEAFRLQLEQFREEVVETFNKRLRAFADRLLAIDTRLRASFYRDRSCDQETYDRMVGEIQEELRRVGSEYNAHYVYGMDMYRYWLRWYAAEARRIMDIRPYQGG